MQLFRVYTMYIIRKTIYYYISNITGATEMWNIIYYTQILVSNSIRTCVFDISHRIEFVRVLSGLKMERNSPGGGGLMSPYSFKRSMIYHCIIGNAYTEWFFQYAHPTFDPEKFSYLKYISFENLKH